MIEEGIYHFLLNKMKKELVTDFAYYYIVFEFNSQGYTLKEEYKPVHYKDLENEYHLIRDFIDLRMYQGYSNEKIISELKILKTYSIATHNKEINPNNEYMVLNFQYGKHERNVIYYIETQNKIDDFTNISRFDESQYKFFLDNTDYINGLEGSSIETYLN